MAAFIPGDKISEIKNSADIVDIISEAVILKKAGRNFVGLCPFHSEKTPSFSVSPEKQIFYCFGCGMGGNVFSFLMKHEGLSFPEAVKMLAKRYGIEIAAHSMSPEQKRKISEKENLFDLNRHAKDFFHQTLLNNAAGIDSVAYLKKRGITDKTIKNFSLGYAPPGWDNLLKFLLKKQISLKLAQKSGLIICKKNKYGYYDRFRNRIIFPIFDLNKQVLGFGGRVMDDSLPKYLNSPESPIYSKSKSLYGLGKAKHKCRKDGSVYIAEGYFDLLSLHQHKIENSVATLGTALTSEHIRLLKGYAQRVILVYDSDEAGINAARKCAGIFIKEDVDARIMILPPGYDPDSYLFKFGSKAFMDAASNASSIMDFLIESAIKRNGLSVEGKIRIISDLIDPITSINDNLIRSLYIKRLSERIGIDEAAILGKIRKTFSREKKCDLKRKGSGAIFSENSRHISSADTARKKKFLRKENRFERQIVAMMLQYPEILPEINSRNLLDLFEDAALKQIGRSILDHNEFSDGRVSDFISLFDEQEKKDIAALAIQEELWNREGCLRLILQFETSRKHYKNSLREKIKAAEIKNDHELLLRLLKEKQIQAGRRNQLSRIPFR